jgi:ComEC/Rec2-related protein
LTALLAVAAVLAGVLAGERLGPGPAGAPVTGAALAVVGGVVLRHRRGPLLLLALALAATASMQRALDGLDGPVAQLARDGAEVVVSARLTDDPRSEWRGTRVALRLEVLVGIGDPSGPRLSREGTSEVTVRDSLEGPGGSSGVGGLVLAVAREDTAFRLRLLSAGDVVVLSGRLAPLRGWETGLRWRHLAARLDVADLVALGPDPSGLYGLAGRLRRLVERGTAGLPLTERALVAGFLLGDTRELPGEVAADFRASGLSHLLAVSGANVALALALAAPVLRCFGLKGRLVGGAGVVVVFAAMTRFEPSVLRASAMAGLSLLAVFLGRPASAGRLLALAVAGLLLVDPFLVHSLGFRLSVAASAGIVALARPLAGRLPGPRPFGQALAVTAAAQVGVAPVAVPAFGDLPLVALPANLLAAPLAAALGVWGLGAGLLGGLLAGVWPDVTGLLNAPSGALAAGVASVAATGASVPGRVDLQWGWGVLAVAALASAALQSHHAIQRRLSRADEYQGDRPGGDHEVEREAGLTRRTDQAQVPLHLEDDGDHLGGQEQAPQAGEEPDGDEGPADELDDHDDVGHQIGDGHVFQLPDGVGEAGDAAVDLAPPVVGHDGPDHQAQGQGGEVVVPPSDGEAHGSHGRPS